MEFPSKTWNLVAIVIVLRGQGQGLCPGEWINAIIEEVSSLLQEWVHYMFCLFLNDINYTYLWGTLWCSMLAYIAYCSNQGRPINLLQCLSFLYDKNIQNPSFFFEIAYYCYSTHCTVQQKPRIHSPNCNGVHVNQHFSMGPPPSLPALGNHYSTLNFSEIIFLRFHTQVRGCSSCLPRLVYFT